MSLQIIGDRSVWVRVKERFYTAVVLIVLSQCLLIALSRTT